MPKCVKCEEKLFSLNIKKMGFSEPLSFMISSRNNVIGKVQSILKENLKQLGLLFIVTFSLNRLHLLTNKLNHITSSSKVQPQNS